MEVVRSKVPVTIPGRSETRKGLVAIYISEWKWQDKFNRYVAEVTDFEITDRLNPQPGEPLKNYIPISHKTTIRTKEEIDTMFNTIAQDIMHGYSYTDQNTEIRVKGLLLETQQDPIRDSLAGDWEIFDTSTEIAP